MERAESEKLLTFVLLSLLGISLLKGWWVWTIKPILMRNPAAGFDFRFYYNQAVSAMKGVEELYGFPFPLFAIYAPFTVLDIETAWLAFLAVNSALLLLFAVMVIKILEAHLSRPTSPLEKLLVVTLFAAYGPCCEVLRWGNYDMFFNLCVLGAWYAFVKGRRVLAGILAGFGALIRLPLLFLLLFFALKREKETLLTSVSVFFAGSALIAALRPQVLAGNVQLVTQFMETPRTISLYSQLFLYLGQPSAAYAMATLGALLIALMAYVMRTKIQSIQQFGFEYSVAVLAMVALSPYLWPRHFTLIFPALVLLLFHLKDKKDVAMLGLIYASAAIWWWRWLAFILFSSVVYLFFKSVRGDNLTVARYPRTTTPEFAGRLHKDPR